MATLLVTGGAGYVGSHTVHDLADRNHEPVVFDNFSHGHRPAIDSFPLVRGDLRRPGDIQKAFRNHAIDAVLHFASSALVGESMENPGLYYENNVLGTHNLLQTMIDEDVRRIVFSSSAAVYGRPDTTPIPESADRSPMNPYGKTKLAVEHMLEDFGTAHNLGYVSLRYFNAAGAWPERGLGENHDPETHLIPKLFEAALKEEETFAIYGTDFPTPDGTCVRDFVHVRDLADAHATALKHLEPGTEQVYNLGTGDGYSVREVVEKARALVPEEFTVKQGDRRPGDPPELVADPSRIKREWDWEPEWSSLEEILTSAWEWHSKKFT